MVWSQLALAAKSEAMNTGDNIRQGQSLTRPKWQLFRLSEQGRRENNEDNCLIKELSDGIYFFAVADGMGGVGGGEVASSLVLEFAEAFLPTI